MIKLSFLTFFLFLTIHLSAQLFVESVNINELEDVHYCEMRYHNTGFNNGGTARINYGQKGFKINANKQYRIHENGQPKVFNSHIDVLNFIGKNGWEFIESRSELVNGNISRTVYLFKRKRDK